MYAVEFIKAFIRSPRDVGTFAESSRVLAEVITECACIHQATIVLEFGAGTGAVTESILRKLPEDSQFMAFEINPDFAEIARRRCPRARIILDSVANARRHLQAAGLEHCDAIVSGLPWASFTDALQDELLAATLDVLKPGGRFATFTYIHSPFLPAGKRFREKLHERFSQVDQTPIVWRNLIPALVYAAVK